MASAHQAVKLGAETRACSLSIAEDFIHLVAQPLRYEVYRDSYYHTWYCGYSSKISFVSVFRLAGVIFAVQRGALTLLRVIAMLKAKNTEASKRAILGKIPTVLKQYQPYALAFQKKHLRKIAFVHWSYL